MLSRSSSPFGVLESGILGIVCASVWSADSISESVAWVCASFCLLASSWAFSSSVFLPCVLYCPKSLEVLFW